MDPRDQDRQLERFREVVVGPRLESAEHVLRTAASREHEDRHVLTSRAQLGCHREAVLPRQHHVEQDGVERLSLTKQKVQGRFTV